MTELPIQHILKDVQTELHNSNRLIVQAPPGAGKSTALPLALLNESWLNHGETPQQIWLLEPRRLAAEQVARRLASSLNEPLGHSIGLMTGELSKISQANRLVVMTEGLLAQRLIKDNDIAQCALIIFDEFHERSMQSDLGLALAIQCQDYLRDDLKILIMSATLDMETLATKLQSQTLTSEGRTFAVGAHYRPAFLLHNRVANLDQQIYKAVRHALAEHNGDILVFLPGVKEIRQCERLLNSEVQNDFIITPLHGQLTWQQQRLAMDPNPKRKIILATDIAKTSVTLAGVTVVIDSGLERLAQYDPRQAMDELITVKASQASCIQRTGRAGRVQAGSCYRLFSEEDFNSRPQFSKKAMQLSDSAQLALNFAAWGSLNLNDYFLLDQPEPRRWQSSLELLEQLNITHENTLTPHGKSLSQLPLHPRLAHMIIKAMDLNLGATACWLAAILSESDPLHYDFAQGNNSDLEIRLQLFMGSSLPSHFEHGQVRKKIAQRIQKLSHKLQKKLNIKNEKIEPHKAGLLIMLAYPDRIAKKRGGGYRLRNGQGCEFLPQEYLKETEFLAVAHLTSSLSNSNKQQQGLSKKSFIRLAASIDINDIQLLFSDQISQHNVLSKSPQNQLINCEQNKLGALILSEKDKQDVIDLSLALQARQSQEDDMSILPKVGLEDVPADLPSYESKEINAVYT